MGGKHFHFPSYVWSPAGGWWGKSGNWRLNTLIAFGVMGIITFGVTKKSLELENWIDTSAPREPYNPDKH